MHCLQPQRFSPPPQRLVYLPLHPFHCPRVQTLLKHSFGSLLNRFPFLCSEESAKSWEYTYSVCAMHKLMFKGFRVRGICFSSLGRPKENDLTKGNEELRNSESIGKTSAGIYKYMPFMFLNYVSYQLRPIHQSKILLIFSNQLHLIFSPSSCTQYRLWSSHVYQT